MRSKIIPYLLLILLCGAVYANVLCNEFVSDDVSGIVTNPGLRSLRGHWLEPQELLGALLFRFFHLQPLPYHLASIVLHALVTLLVFVFLQLFFNRNAETPGLKSGDECVAITPTSTNNRVSPETIQRVGVIRGTPGFRPERSISTAAWWGACLFAVHPVHAEAVAWISGQPYLFSGLFTLIVYLCYWQAASLYGKAGAAALRWYAAALAAFSYFIIKNHTFFSLVPLLLIGTDIVYGRFRRTWKLWLPFLFVTLIVLAGAQATLMSRLQITAIDPLGRVHWRNSFVYCVYSLSTHLWLLLWPERLALYHEPVVLDYLLLGLRAGLLVGGVAFLPYLCRRHKPLVIGLLVFILFLFPTYAPLRISSIVAERYLYLPVMLLSVIVSFLYGRCTDKASGWQRILAALVCGGIIVSCGLRTVYRNIDWRTSWSLTESNLRQFPRSWRAHDDLGQLYLLNGNLTAAMREFQQAIDCSAGFYPAYSHLGVVYHQLGRNPEALYLLQRAIRLNPRAPEAYYNLGTVYAQMGRRREAMDSYAQAIARSPRYVKAYVNLGNLYFEEGRHEEALGCYRQALTIDPESEVARHNLALSEVAAAASAQARRGR